MLFSAGFLTHCSYYKFKILVLFCQSCNQPILNSLAKFKVIFAIFVSQLNCICLPHGTYSTVHIFIQSIISINNFTNSQMTFQHFCSRANSTVIILSTRTTSNTIELKKKKYVKQIFDFINDLLQRFRTSV